MKKRVFSFILVLTMIVSVLPNMAFAEEVVQEVAEESGTTDDGLWGYVAGEDGVVLTQYNGSATDVYVPGSIEVNGEELFVAKLGDYVFADNTGLNSATLGEGIREIGEGTFRNADNMVCVLVPEGLLTIGNEPMMVPLLLKIFQTERTSLWQRRRMVLNTKKLLCSMEISQN